MTGKMLTAAGVLNQRGRFLRMPAETHAVWFDDVTVDSADRIASIPSVGLPRTYTHDVTVEVYEPKPDDEKEAAFEAELDAHGLSWTKQDRYWLDDVQRYQVIYEYSYTTK
jgi:predicted mannosyl-3-phosphoglycerate phosphatase (HAD superfamily)